MSTKIVLGRGEVYFDPFEPGGLVGTGERYIGNTPTFRVQRDLRQQARRTSYRGNSVDLPPGTLGEQHTIQFATDHIAMENVALWYGGDGGEAEEIGYGGTTETFTVNPGRYYQLGMSVRPAGMRNLRLPQMQRGGVEVNPSGNYSIELSTGRFHIFPEPVDLVKGDEVNFSFEWQDQTVSSAASKPAGVLGALRYIARNDVGPRHNYFFPCVELVANGQVDLKGDQFQRIGFEATAFNLRPGVDQVIVDAA